MDSFAPLLFLLFFSFVVSMISKAFNAAKKAQKPPKTSAAPREEAAPAPVKEAALPPEPRILRPTVRVTEHDDTIYQGSMNAETGEGFDPCHEEQLAPLTLVETLPAEPPQAAPSPILPRFTGGEIARGFVMAEILNRRRTAG